MGLSVILAALHVSLSRREARQDAQDDAEKGPAEEDEDANGDDGGTMDDEGHDGIISDDEDGGYDPLADPARRLHRLQSATDNTFFSTSVDRPPDVDSRRPWYAKVKDYIFPPRESDAALDKFVPNYRWTPVLSGVLIPFSLLLEIPGLTEHWYVRTEANAVVESKSNPAILDVGLAFSMACGLFANISLVLRFLEKRVKTVTLLTIVFLTIHDLINIVTVIIFGVEHRFDDGFTYGQSFWMTVCSTIASTTTNITLIVDFVRTPKFARSGSGLTRKQRALMIIVIVLLVYVAFGALVNSLIHDLNFIDGLYFTVVTIETIGFGDITPDTTGQRIFICFYMAFGILNVGVAVAMTRETVLEGLELGYRKRLQNLQLRRREARRYRRWEARWLRAVEWRLKEAGQPVWVPDKRFPDEAVRFVGLRGEKHGAGEVHWMKRWLTSLNLRDPSEARKRHIRGHPRGKHLNLDALTPQQLEAAALEAGVPLEMFLAHRQKRPETDRHDSRLSSSSSTRPNVRGLMPFVHRRRPLGSNWPMNSQTPTHAQVGRMAAMLTKFAMAVTGTHVKMLGHVPEERAHEEGNGSGEGEAVVEGDGDPATKQTRPTDETQAERDDTQGANGPWADEAHSSKEVTPDESLHPQTPSWTKDLARGRNMKSGIMYENYKEDMEAEEKKAYWVKLTVAWSLFLLFWTVGSAIFSATEGWSYGSAMYFCFLAFTTTGYGDFAPTTPAGRSVFVVWALLGVAAMTILISVIEEVGSSRYRSALHSKTFDSAVKKFRERENAEAKRLSTKTTPRVPRAHSDSSLDDALHSAKEAAQRELEGLPRQIIQQARTFHDHVHFFVNSGAGVAEEAATQKNTTVPKELRELLDELAEVEDLGERVKQEIMEDDDTRNTLLMLSIERTLRKLINSAERSLGALAERDALVAMKETHEHRQDDTKPPTPHSSSDMT